MAISVRRQYMRGEYGRTMNRINRQMKDFSPVIRRAAEVCRDRIRANVLSQHTDTWGHRFKALKEETRLRKQDQRTLIETGAMIDTKSFTITAGKQRGLLVHKAPAGTHTRYAKKTRTGKVRQMKYDYGLAHQYGRVQRQWWLEPGSKMWEQVQKRVNKFTKAWILEGRVPA